jgi:ubiquinol-cytochrome c reductase cytochrome b subunit
VDESTKPNSPQHSSAISRIYGWLDRRTGLSGIMHAALDEPVPGGARLAYVFGSGLLFIFISQVITGLCLALYYVPSAETAHTSVAYITKQVAAGAFLRSLHYYGSSAMIVVLALHFLQTFLYGSYKGRRELLWISGALLSLLILAMGFTGYLLPWDQKAYFATSVGTNIVGEIPFIGEWLTRLLRGGDTLGTLTLSRFYIAHLFLIPGAIFLLIAAHIALFRKAGPAGPINEDPVQPKLAPESFYPRQVLMDMGFALLLIIGLGVLAYFHPVALGPVANPADTQFLPRPEWYYLPMFEWLKLWQGPWVVFAVVVIPAILALLFFLLPFLDRGLERRPWRRPIPLLGVAIVLVAAVFLGVKSRLDDSRDPSAAAQIARQDQQEAAYSKAPFEPYMESPGGLMHGLAVSAPVNPLVAQGRGIFEGNGCSGCHGEAGGGTPVAPSLVGITSRYTSDQLALLLRNPNAKMRAGRMPAADLSTGDMSALLNYLGALGTSAADVPAAYNLVPQPRPMVAANKAAPNVAAARVPTNATVTLTSGQQMFQSHACFACHGESGTGTARAPGLAGPIAKLSDAQLIELLQNPDSKMRAGGMSPLIATPSQLTSLVSYLRTIPRATAAPARVAAAPAESVGETNTQPPTTAMAPAQPIPPPTETAPAPSASTAPVPASIGRSLFVANGCAACHGTNGGGTRFAPALTGIARKYPSAQLAGLLRHPSNKMRDGGMPAVNLPDPGLQQLVDYLSSLGAAPPTAATASMRPQGAQSAPSVQTAEVNRAATEQVNTLALTPEARRGRVIFERNNCESCHGIGGLSGTVAAPGLAGTASILPATVLEDLLRHHSKSMQKGGMPLTNMNPQDMNAIVTFIRSLPNTSQ